MVAGNVQQLLEAGIAAARANKRVQARELLTRAVRQDPGNEQGWLWLAGVVDRPRETVYCLEQALILNPNNEAAQQGIAWARRQLAPSTPAATPAAPPAAPPTPATPTPPVAPLLKVVSSAPGTAPAPPPPSKTPLVPEERETLAARLAADKASLPRWEARGLASLRSLETVDEMVARGKSVLEQGRIREAADILRGAIARQPDHAKAHAQLAVACYNLGDKRGALVEFENAIAIDPAYVDALLSLGLVYEELGETKAAIHCWERVLELEPDHAEVRQSLEKARATQTSRYQCPDCGTTLSGLEPTCPQCGRVFFVRCANCGEYAEEKDETCPRCGAQLKEVAEPPPQPEDVVPEEAQGPQIACLRCGSLNPTYHTRCAICGAPIGGGDAAAPAAPFPTSRRRLRFTWLLVALLCWVSACGLCLWGGYAGYQLVPLADLGSVDPIGVAGDLLGRQINDSLLVVAVLGTSLLLGFVGLVGLRQARS